MCEMPLIERPLTGTDVLDAIKPKRFHNPYIKDLTATRISWPGYHPGDSERGLYNDEIHNDFSKQHIFENADEVTQAPVNETNGTHGQLKNAVSDGKLWYVLLHTALIRYKDQLFGNMVILFAVGKSKHGDRLIGVVTHQVCHNLCD